MGRYAGSQVGTIFTDDAGSISHVDITIFLCDCRDCSARILRGSYRLSLLAPALWSEERARTGLSGVNSI